MRVFPPGVSRALTRHAVPIALALAVFIIFAGVAVAALVSPSALGIQAARVVDTTTLPDSIATSGLSERDSDNDGLSDSLENYLYGTDPNNWDSSGLGIPDGWLVQFGYDPLSPLTANARGAAPPADKLPEAYANGYAIEYTPKLMDYYNYSKPADYRAGTDPLWWRTGSHADPANWDQTGTGIPNGWLLHYGLDPQRAQPDAVVEGSKGNLTLREAFTYNTNPLALDSDGDGITDWLEAKSMHTNPALFSTSGSAIADGWLARYGLNLFDRAVGSQDADLDGLTNLEEFVISYDHNSAEVGGARVEATFTKGLDPLEWDSSRTRIPDGWYVKYGLSPFDTDTSEIIRNASDWAEVLNLNSAPEGQNRLADFSMTIRDAYSYGRPTDWNEATQGVWWGGTDPSSGDTDADGIPDVNEIRGWYANVTTETGPEAKPRVYLATSNPLAADSDSDGLADIDEYRGTSTCGPSNEAHTFPMTDPRNRDTAFSGLTDFEKVCGAQRGQIKYDFRNATAGLATLDPTKADSAGDYMRDGARLQYWHDQFIAYKANPRYPFPDSAYKTVFEWTEKYGRFSGVSQEDTLLQFRPDGDVDGDSIPNVLDSDPAGGLHVQKFGPPGTALTKTYFLGGPQMDPELYRFTEFASSLPHSATDPANPDTDGDGLPDEWETRYGAFDAQFGGWNLDPAKADSNKDGITDAQANNDGDVITWYAYVRRGSDWERVTNLFVFDNVLEFAAGTNPNEVSSLDDGVPDGWKAFWGSRVSDDTWPNLFTSRDSRIGDLATERANEIENAMSSSQILPATNLKGLGSKTTGYVRFANVSTCDVASESVKSLLKPGEQFARNACYSGQNLEGNDIRVVTIEGAFSLSYRKESELRTNPFMFDSDGDGATDAFEAYYQVKSPGTAGYPDPAARDTDKDPDNDGIGVSDECKSADAGRRCGFHTYKLGADAIDYGAGSDPNAADSDGDGIQDGIEFNAGLDALDPSDIDSFRRPDLDTDRDGVPDYQELTGWGKPEFGVSVRTDPKDPDTDNDGLVDGATLTLDYLKTPTNDAQKQTNAQIEGWCARGLAHKTTAVGGAAATGIGNICAPGMNATVTRDLTITFLGERTYGTAFGFRPDVALTAGLVQETAKNIPDGWLAYYSENPKEKTVDAAAYGASRPEWWVEKIHGVWWWGRAPGAAPVDDLDQDGLHDATGEDPLPSLRLNVATIGGQTIRNPAALATAVQAGTSLDDLRARAQRMGDGAGDPTFARTSAFAATDANGVPTRLDRAKLEIIDFELPNGTTLTKGVAFAATGRVVLNERLPAGGLLEGSENNRVGIANRTVIIGAFGPDRGIVLGVGFTNATGAFNVSSNITNSLRVTVPEGAIVLGSVGGTITIPQNPSLLATGDKTKGETNTIIAWVTNTSATVNASSPTYSNHAAWLPDAAGVHAQRATTASRFAITSPIAVSVRSDTVFKTTAETTLDNGALLSGDLTLEDASAAPLADRSIKLRWTGITPAVEFLNLSTDQNGRVNLTHLGIRASVGRADQYALIATFTSTDPNLGSVATPFPISVRNPTVLTVRVDKASATVGDTLVVTGQLFTRDIALASGGTTGELPVAGATIRVSLGGATETARTDDRGAFQTRITVPGSLAAGPTNVQIKFDGTTTESPTEQNVPTSIKRTALINGLTRIEGPRSISVSLRGKLVDNEGQGFRGPIHVDAGGARAASGASGDNGEFVIVLPLTNVPLGTQTIRVSFPGDAQHASAENFTQGRITSTTTLSLEGAPPTLVRGESFDILATLRDDRNKPVPGVAVGAFWRGERVALAVTDAFGQINVTIQSDATERPAMAAVGLESFPQITSVYQPASAAATVRVVQGTLLSFEPQSVHRGVVAFTGRLIDDEGRPLAAAPIRVALNDITLGEARTSRNGSFELARVLPDDQPLGPVPAEVSYDGTATLSGATNATTWHVRTPLVLSLKTLGPFVRGEAAPIEGKLTDDRGKPITALLRASLGSRDAQTLRITDGVVKGGFSIPADFARGDATFTLYSNATDSFDAYSESFPVVVKIRPKVDVRLPALAVRGFSFTGELTLRDDKGQPLPNTTFVYALGKGNGLTAGVTDSDGRATVASTAPLAGDTFLSLTVRGGSDVVAAEYKTPTLRLVGPATPIGYAGLIIFALIVIGIIAVVVAAAILRRRQLGEVREILDDAIRDLLAGNEYAGTVFLAYRRLSAHLARHGFAEKASETPREFAVGVRKALPLSSLPLKELIRLFEEARYSDHAVGSVQRDRAVENLSMVRAEIDRLIGRNAKQGGQSS